MPRLRPLGSTALRVSPVGLGLAAVGRPTYITTGRGHDLGADRRVESLEARSHALLDAAWDAGVRYLDVARSYGRAEEFLAHWLSARGLAPGELTIGSKWGYTYVGDWRLDAPVQEVKDHSVGALRRQIKESRTLLDGHLQLYQVHSATLESGILTDRAVLAELAVLAERGLVIGLTVSGARQAEVIRRALQVEVDGLNPFRTVQATWNLLETSAGPALAEAHAAGWGVLVKEALANGRLAAQTEDRAADLTDIGPLLGEVARAHGATMDAVAIAAALDNPWADVVLSGAATVTQLRSNLAALELHLTPETVSRLTRAAEIPARYWSARGARPWN